MLLPHSCERAQKALAVECLRCSFHRPEPPLIESRVRKVKAVERRHDRERLSVPVVGELDKLRRQRRLAGARRAGDSEQEPFPVRLDGREQLVGQRYSLLDRAQRLMSLSVA
jgi:hypothetical protein